MNSDLSLLPIEALFEEIANRTENAIFAYERFEGGNAEPLVKSMYKGNALLCMGLCKVMDDHLINQFGSENL